MPRAGGEGDLRQLPVLLGPARRHPGRRPAARRPRAARRAGPPGEGRGEGRQGVLRRREGRLGPAGRLPALLPPADHHHRRCRRGEGPPAACLGIGCLIESYSRRTHVEGIFGNVKSAKTADLQRGWIFIVGMVKTSLMLAAVAVATNIRLLRKWAARTGDRVHALCAVDPVDHGFEERDADGNPDLALAPPIEA